MQKKKKTVIVLGKGDLAIKIASWFKRSNEYELIAIVPQIPEPTWARSFLEWAEDKQIPIIRSGDYKEIFRLFPKQNIDLCVSVFYDKIIKNDLIVYATKLVNIHNSPLPKYRGVKPIHWALKNNEKYHGVTIHEITEGIDDGPILSQVSYSIYPELEEVFDVYQRSLKYAWILFLQTIPYIWSIKPIQQDHSLATYFSLKEDSMLGDRLGVTRKK